MVPKYLNGLVLLLLIFLFGRAKKPKMKTGSDPVRGIRNNNPGNIRKSSSPWRGKTGNDGEFEIFESMEYGARAQMKLLINYINNGFDTVRKITQRWSPPTDNNPTDQLIIHYAKEAKVDPDEKIRTLPPLIRRLALAMGKIETGNHPEITSQLYERAYKLL